MNSILINRKNIILSLVFITGSILITGFLNLNSLKSYFYFFALSTAFILTFDRKETTDFVFVFVINSFLTAVFYLIQCKVYPDSYGTTSPFGSWTDDSYFFAIIADHIPPTMVVRDQYWLYYQFFSDFIRHATPFSVSHPLDVVYFQSGVAAILATYSKQFAIQMSGDKKLGKIVFYLCAFSPFLLMHGGAILIRDTFVSALFILSLCCINRKRYISAAVCIIMQFPMRIGTGFLFMPLYIIIYYDEIIMLLKQKRNIYYIIGIFVISITAIVYFNSIIIEYLEELLLSKGVTATGREVFDDLTADKNGNAIFLFIQNQNVFIKGILSSAYIFLYPFLSFKGIMNSEGFDARTFLLNIYYPITLFWLNSWFFSAVISKVKVIDKQKAILVALVVGFILIGIISIQTRHKTIMLPLYYLFVAIGYRYSSKQDKLIGYGLSTIWFLAQIALSLRFLFS